MFIFWKVGVFGCCLVCFCLFELFWGGGDEVLEDFLFVNWSVVVDYDVCVVDIGYIWCGFSGQDKYVVFGEWLFIKFQVFFDQIEGVFFVVDVEGEVGICWYLFMQVENW